MGRARCPVTSSASASRSTRSGPAALRDCVTLLHLPYTAWHLSYVALGAGLAAHVERRRGSPGRSSRSCSRSAIAAHCLDELHGRPLATHLPSSALVTAAAVSLARAAAIGLWAVARHRRLPRAVRAHRRRARARLQPRAVRRSAPHRPRLRARLGRVPRARRRLRPDGLDRAAGRARRLLRHGDEPRPALTSPTGRGDSAAGGCASRARSRWRARSARRSTSRR